MKVSLLTGLCAWLVVALAGQLLQAQYAGMPPGSSYNYGDRPGRFAVGPASYEQGEAPMYDGGPGGGGPGGCGPEGYGGEEDCGEGCDQFGAFSCRPRWFNIAFDFIYLTREEVSRTVDFTRSDSVVNNPFAPVVLSTNSLDFDHEPGFRATAQFIWGPAANIELTYFGTLFYNTAARATGTDSLFSAFSNFGLIPVDGLGVPVGGFNDSDQADVQTLEYESHVDSGEINYRSRFISPNGRIQSSWLVGARYVRVDDDFRFTSVVDRVQAGNPITGNLSYETRTTNDLFGFQVGGDLTLSVTRCLTFGGELKAGLCGNYAVQKTDISATVPSASTFFETADHNSAALVSEANVYVVLFLTEHVNVRSGYQLMYVDGVALAPENVNFARANNGSFSNRLVSIEDTGNVFLHGLTFGAEITW